jgi:alpha-beta hydrolase superfamily lysophospholipase
MLAPAPQIRFVTARDGYRFATRLWHVENPTAHVVCVHGIVSHGGWYLSSGAHLAREGFGVHLLDRRGSGLNQQDRGDVDRWKTWLSDVEDYLERLPGQIPRILLGISWGGTLAAAVARHRSDLLHGVGLLCPGLFSRKAANLVQRAALHILRRTGFQRSRVTIPLQDPALFTASPSAQQYIATDPLSLWKMTIAFALENTRLIRYATEKPEEIHTPTLAMLAELDPIAVNSKVREFVERVGHPDKRVIEYAGASHTLEFEPDPSRYFRDLAAWCAETAQTERR